MKLFDGEPMFPMLGLMSIPASNSESEGDFSMLRKIHTDLRPTLNAVMTPFIVKSFSVKKQLYCIINNKIHLLIYSISVDVVSVVMLIWGMVIS